MKDPFEGVYVLIGSHGYCDWMVPVFHRVAQHLERLNGTHWHTRVRLVYDDVPFLLNTYNMFQVNCVHYQFSYPSQC